MNLNNLANSFMPEPTPSTAKNILTNDVDIKGTIKFENELIFDGKIEGEIVSDAGTLTLGKNADVRGEVRTKAVTVHGNVTGNISVSERCELKASSQLNGDLKASRIIIEEGATFIGKSEVTPKTSAKPEFSRSVTPASSSPANSESGRKQAAPASA
jgi:cytoskeletal protein CcmA (bactofilin family)